MVEANANFDRSVKVFDLQTPYDTFKFGVLYVGPNQTKEEEILSNTFGSIDYEKVFSFLFFSFLFSISMSHLFLTFFWFSIFRVNSLSSRSAR